MTLRRKTVPVKIGSLLVGSDHPVRVQSMTTTDTADAEATLAQARRLEDKGCEMIRITVPNRESAAALKTIKRGMRVPLIADVHFDYRMALLAIEAGADKVRMNPGNIGVESRVREVLRAAKAAGCACGSASTPARSRRTCSRSTAGRRRPQWSRARCVTSRSASPSRSTRSSCRSSRPT